jgi:hypothetical protein
MWLRLRQIALVAADIEAAVDDLKAVFGLEVGHIDPGVGAFGLENRILPVGTQFIEIVAPTQEGTAGGRYLERRGGDGGYMVICQCDEHAPRKQRVADLGIRTVMESDRRDYCIMQLHPRDTGGSFLEIDWSVGGEQPGGPWEPAGHDWQKAVRTEVIRAIAAAEIQSPEPDALAQRWSEIIEEPLEPGPGGNPSLRLDNATIRFVPIPDGRPEGLGGIDVVTMDRERALGAARERGLPVDGDTILVCGTRFKLV